MAGVAGRSRPDGLNWGRIYAEAAGRRGREDKNPPGIQKRRAIIVGSAPALRRGTTPERV